MAVMGHNRCKGNGGIMNGDDIPEWLLVEVLIRLSPAKLVCGFKLVSKQWLSVISDPLFIRTYVSRNSVQPWTFISDVMHHQGFKSCHALEYVVLDDVYSQVVKPGYCVLPLPPTQRKSHDRESYMIEGVSNGLVIYGYSKLNTKVPISFIDSYYICNPITRSWVALPVCADAFFADGFGFLTHVEDGVLINYTVVRLEIISKSMTRKNNNLLRFQVFHSEIGELKIYSVFSAVENPSGVRRHASVVNGVLHWIGIGVGIIAYDPYQCPEQVRIIAFPMSVTVSPDDLIGSQGLPHNCVCDEYKGKLRYFTTLYMDISWNVVPNFEVWVLNDHISGGGWSLQHAVNYMDIQYDSSFSLEKWSLVSLAFHPFDLDVMYFGWEDALVSYNIKTKRLQVHQKCCRKNEITPMMMPQWCWNFLLLIPSWPISIP